MWKFQQYLDNCCKINTVLKHWYVAWEMIHRHIFNNNTQFISQYCISTNKIHYMYQDSLHHRGKTDGLVHLMAQVWLCSDHQRQHFRFRKTKADDHYSPGAGQVKTHRQSCSASADGLLKLCISSLISGFCFSSTSLPLLLNASLWLVIPMSFQEHKTATVLIILHNRDINEEAFKTLF